MSKKEEKKNKKLYIIIGVILFLACSIGFYIGFTSVGTKDTDAKKFASEYPVDKDNVFVYRTLEEINNILENGTGLIFLGFPECPWCRGYLQ